MNHLIEKWPWLSNCWKQDRNLPFVPNPNTRGPIIFRLLKKAEWGPWSDVEGPQGRWRSSLALHFCRKEGKDRETQQWLVSFRTERHEGETTWLWLGPRAPN